MRTLESFASMAEARAHYYKQGYVNLEGSCTPNRYVVHRPEPDQLLCPLIELLKVGFLKVQVTEL